MLLFTYSLKVIIMIIQYSYLTDYIIGMMRKSFTIPVN